MRDVPYFSQWACPQATGSILAGLDPCDDPKWREKGFPDAQAYRFWSRRLCGLACLESMLAYWKIDHPNRYCLLQEAIAEGAYVRSGEAVQGLIYRPFATWVSRRFGLQAESHSALSLSEIAPILDNDGFVMASVAPSIRHPDSFCATPGGHLVLIYAMLRSEIFFHNPSGVPPHQSAAVLDLSRFAYFYAKRGISVQRSRGPR